MIHYSMNLDRYRRGQLGIHETSIGRIVSGEGMTSIVGATGVGKSDTIRNIGLELYCREIICTNLVLTPNAYLRDQLFRPDKMEEWKLRYSIHCDCEVGYQPIEQFPSDVNALSSRNEVFVCMTMQMLIVNATALVRWAKRRIAQTGKPLLITVDEVHMNSILKPWGVVVQELIDLGARLLVLTATPYRDDGAPILGFHVRPLQESDIRFVRAFPGPKPDVTTKRLYEGVKQTYMLEADFTYTFAEAWDDGVISRLAQDPFDLDVPVTTNSGQKLITQRLLSEIPENIVREHLGKWVRDPKVVAEGCRRLVHWLKHLRQAAPHLTPRAKAIVFCGNDRDGDPENDAHAKQILQALKRIAPDLRVIIVNSGDEADGNKTLLEKFVSQDIADIIIVKQMAGLGLDCKELKVGLDLSPVRTLAALMQRMMRLTRLHAVHDVAVWISLADILYQKAWEAGVSSQGGELTQISTDMIDEWQDPKQAPPERPQYDISGIRDADYNDNYGNFAPADSRPRVIQFITSHPGCLLNSSPAQVYRDLEEYKQPAPNVRTANSLAELQSERDCINAVLEAITKFTLMRDGIRKDDPSYGQRYGQTIAKFHNEAKTRARISLFTKLGEVYDWDDIRRLRKIVDTMLDEESGR